MNLRGTKMLTNSSWTSRTKRSLRSLLWAMWGKERFRWPELNCGPWCLFAFFSKLHIWPSQGHLCPTIYLQIQLPTCFPLTHIQLDISITQQVLIIYLCIKSCLSPLSLFTDKEMIDQSGLTAWLRLERKMQVLFFFIKLIYLPANSILHAEYWLYKLMSLVYVWSDLWFIHVWPLSPK